MGTINGLFLYNTAAQNGATAKLWKITAFASYADSTKTVLDDPLAATSVECNSSGGGVFAVGDVIKMGTECCLIWKISTNKLYIIRGWHQTTPAEHVATTAIYDEIIAPPERDDSEPGSGQQGSSVTTGITYGGDGAYRFDSVPEMEYYASVYYNGHRSFIHHFVERDDPTLLQILLADGDIAIRNGDTVTRLAKSTNGYVLTLVAGRPAWLAPGDVDTLDGFHAIDLIKPLTVVGFQVNAATGNMVDPSNANDNNTGTQFSTTALNKYIEVDWGEPLLIKQYRHYGDARHNGTGRMKLQYWDGNAWVNWETGIVVEATGAWTDWVSPAAGAKSTTKIRFVVTTLDTAGNIVWFKELEVKY